MRVFSSTLFASLTVSLLVVIGCGRSKPAATPDNESAVDRKESVCKALVSIAGDCYNSGAKGVECTEARQTAMNAAEKSDMAPSLRDSLGKLCEASCNVQKNGGNLSELQSNVYKGCQKG